jgi:hypothetical protein
MKISVPFVSLALLAAFTLSACDTPGHSALAGAGIGAAAGALLTGRPGGALLGAAAGAGTGYLVGKQVQRDRDAAYEDGYNDGRYADNRDYRDDGGDRDRGYPMGRPTDRPGFVVSPYPPYNRIDVRGIPRGARVQDPSTGRIFINP